MSEKVTVSFFTIFRLASVQVALASTYLWFLRGTEAVEIKRIINGVFRLSIGKAFLQPRYQLGFPSCPMCPENGFTTNLRSITVVFPSCRASFSSFLLPIKCFNIVLWMRKLKGKVYYLMLTMIPYRTMARAVVETGAQGFVLRRCHLSRNEIPYSHHQLLKK